MLFKWFDTKAIEAFSDAVTKEFTTRVTPEVAAKKERGAEKKLSDARELCLQRVEKFAASTRLNLYQRAKLANLIRWKLIDAGLDQALVEDLTLAVAKLVATQRGQKNER